MSHPIQTWFARHISHPLTEMYARLDEHQLDEAYTEHEVRPARATPVDISWMPVKGSRSTDNHPLGR